MKQRKFPFETDSVRKDYHHHTVKIPKPSKAKSKRKFKDKEEYYSSPEWKIKRAFALNRANHRCEKCGNQNKLEVHHLTYDRLYDERSEDLQVLCPKCHPKADDKRAEDNWFENALDTYATKKYGEDWSEYMDESEVAEEFEAWLESKGKDEW